MTQEADFIRQLQEHPDDDDTRQVYADWLEEGGDVRAEYLRLEHLLRTIPRRLAQLREQLDPSWVASVSRSLCVVLVAYQPQRKIQTIKVIRDVTGLGLADAKNVSERPLPKTIKGDLTLDEANRIADLFKDIATVTVIPWVEKS
jgi:uncharacterized protein (TIGR02996 family)